MVYYACGNIIINAALGQCTEEIVVREVVQNKALVLLDTPLFCTLLQKVSHFSTTILSAMLAGMDDREDPEDLITMEAMSGLSRIFSQIDEGHVRPILINIALRIRPCFEKVCITCDMYKYTQVVVEND